jgi:diguanylate cyclase (GGDEF)-like protein
MRRHSAPFTSPKHETTLQTTGVPVEFQSRADFTDNTAFDRYVNREKAVAGAQSAATMLQQKKELEEAHFDTRLGLPNVKAWEAALPNFERHARESGITYYSFLLDVNGLKIVNDDPDGGHPLGNSYLASVGDAVRGSMFPGDSAFRVGGDEVVLVMEKDSDMPSVEELAVRIGKRVNDALSVDPRIQKIFIASGSDKTPGISIGGEEWDGRRDSLKEGLPALADEKLYLDKKRAQQQGSVARGVTNLIAAKLGKMSHFAHPK